MSLDENSPAFPLAARATCDRGRLRPPAATDQVINVKKVSVFLAPWTWAQVGGEARQAGAPENLA